MTTKNSDLRPLFFAGTGSDVGKSVIAAAFCRIFLQDGYRPAPFKAQNMALNSYATPEGLEIGRAQAVQAEAAGVPCHTDMNPLLLKPTTDQMAQVVLNGKSIGNQSAFQYFKPEGRDTLRKEVCNAFDRLEKRYNPIVMEGAGSISEINLRETDLVNLPMAQHAGASVILVADIDRGGVFGSVYGSILLLNEEERKLVKGILINKFRGDIRLFESGITLLEELCGIPVVGVVPYFRDIYMEEEDSVMLYTKNRQASQNKINIAVILLKHLSNFTDFNALERDPRVHLYYTNQPDEITRADVILIPGSKSTLSDLYDIRKNGIAQSIVCAHKNGATVMGICGGYQMMGQEVSDPNQEEGEIQILPGLGLLPVTTQMQGEKITRQVRFSFLDSESICEGYEIHMGMTAPVNDARPSPLNFTQDQATDGYYLNEKCFGTYIHGILDNGAFIEYLLAPYTGKVNEKPFDFKKFKEEQYNKLADHVRSHVNMDLIYKFMMSLLLLLVVSCKPSSQENTVIQDTNKNTSKNIQYARGFAVNETENYKEVTVFNPWSKGKILQRYILVDKDKSLPENLPEGTLIRTPLQRVVSYTSIQCAILSEINQIGIICGVCESQHIDIPFIQEGIKAGNILDLGLASNPDVEKIMILEPEAILSSPLKDVSYGRIEKLGIPMIECVDYMESTPLGRAEWIRFHALFYGEEKRADSLFQATAYSYNQLRKLANSVKYRPSVFTETRYGNAWYMPGGKSYIAHLLKDAGAAYCWGNDTTTGSLSLSFETVLNQAENADFWFIKYNNSRDMTYADLATDYHPYTFFEAYKKKKIYVCNTGKKPYYEELTTHPDYALKDMVWIFHPEILPDYQPRYYEKMKE